MTYNLSKNIMPKVMIVLFAFVLISTIPVASAQFVIGGSSSGGSDGGDRTAPTFTDNSISINQNTVIEDTQFSTVSAQSGNPVEFTVMASDNGGANNVVHLDIFLNHDGNRVLNNLKETYVSFNSFSSDRLFIQNPNGIIESVTMITENVDNDVKFTFNVIFAQTFDTSDILVRSWDLSRNLSLMHFPDAFKVTESTTISSPVNKSPAESPAESPVDSSFTEIFDNWAGYSNTAMSDDDFIAQLGLEGSSVPKWFKQNNSEWFKNGSISYDDFIAALDNLSKRKLL